MFDNPMTFGSQFLQNYMRMPEQARQNIPPFFLMGNQNSAFAQPLMSLFQAMQQQRQNQQPRSAATPPVMSQGPSMSGAQQSGQGTTASPAAPATQPKSPEPGMTAPQMPGAFGGLAGVFGGVTTPMAEMIRAKASQGGMGMPSTGPSTPGFSTRQKFVR